MTPGLMFMVEGKRRHQKVGIHKWDPKSCIQNREASVFEIPFKRKHPLNPKSCWSVEFAMLSVVQCGAFNFWAN